MVVLSQEATKKQRESDPKRVKSKATKPEVDFRYVHTAQCIVVT